MNPDDENERGKKLTIRELNKLSEDEINRFAEEFLQRNPYLYSSDSKVQPTTVPVDFENIDFPKQPHESPSEFLDRTLHEYQQRSLAGVMVGISSALANQFRANNDLSRHVKTLLDDVKIPQKTLTVVTSSNAIPSPVQRINEIVDTLNSLAELNKESVKLVTSLNDLGRDMAIEFAQNAKLTTRLTYAAIAIAVVSLVTSSVFSILTYMQTRDSVNINRLIEQSIQSQHQPHQ